MLIGNETYFYFHYSLFIVYHSKIQVEYDKTKDEDYNQTHKNIIFKVHNIYEFVVRSYIKLTGMWAMRYHLCKKKYTSYWDNKILHDVTRWFIILFFDDMSDWICFVWSVFWNNLLQVDWFKSYDSIARFYLWGSGISKGVTKCYYITDTSVFHSSLLYRRSFFFYCCEFSMWNFSKLIKDLSTCQ